MRKLTKQASFPTIGFGCWPWTASKTIEKLYFVKCLHHDQGHDQGHDPDHDQGRVRAWDRDPAPLIMLMTMIMSVIMIMTLIRTLIMMKTYVFGSCPCPTAGANS